MNDGARIEMAVRRAVGYEEKYHGCAQCVVGGILDAFGIASPEVFRAATGFSGGMGCTGRTCGALTGGTLSVGLFIGRDRDNMEDVERKRWRNFALVKELIERFEHAYGSTECRKVQERVVGIGVDFWNPVDAARFGHEYGGHHKCAVGVVGEVARWTAELVLRDAQTSDAGKEAH